jgi:hypothetical protein
MVPASCFRPLEQGRYLKRIHLNPAKKKELKFEARRFHSCGAQRAQLEQRLSSARSRTIRFSANFTKCGGRMYTPNTVEPFAFRRISPSVEDVQSNHSLFGEFHQVWRRHAKRVPCVVVLSSGNADLNPPYAKPIYPSMERSAFSTSALVPSLTARRAQLDPAPLVQSSLKLTRVKVRACDSES